MNLLASRTTILVALMVLVATALGACGGDPSTPPPPPPSTPVTAATPTPPSAATPTPTAAATPTPPSAATPTPTATATPTPTAAPTPTTAATPTVTATPTPVTITSPQLASVVLDAPSGAFTAIAVGGHRDACAIAESGEIVCWGWGDDAEAVTLSGRYVAIDAGGGKTCAVTEAGEAVCWRKGQLAAQVRPGGYTAVSTIGGYTCGVTEAGDVRCWPSQSDEGDGTESPLGVSAPSGDPFVAVTVGSAVFVDPPITGTTVCAARIGGGRECWLYVPPHHTEGRVEQWARDVDPSAPLVGGDFCSVNGWGFPDCDEYGARYTVISKSLHHVCGVTPDGVAECRAADPFARAYGAIDVIGPPDASPARYVAISMTPIAREADPEAYAEVYGCGRNDPVALCPDSDVIACALTDAGEAVCWRSVQHKVEPPDPQSGPYVAVSDGGYHTCALTVGGAVACWGWNNFGQAGTPSGRYTAVRAGTFHTCALSDTEEVTCWGLIDQLPEGLYGVLTESEIRACVLSVYDAWVCRPDFGQSRAAPPGRFTAIGAGAFQSCALTELGEVVCWGSGSMDGDLPEGRYTALAVGRHHACALTDAGEIACWVWSFEDKTGQVHGSRYEDALTKPPPGSYVAISSNNDRSCGVTEAGEVVCWGDVLYSTPPGPVWSPM